MVSVLFFERPKKRGQARAGKCRKRYTTRPRCECVASACALRCLVHSLRAPVGGCWTAARGEGLGRVGFCVYRARVACFVWRPAMILFVWNLWIPPSVHCVRLAVRCLNLRRVHMHFARGPSNSKASICLRLKEVFFNGVPVLQQGWKAMVSNLRSRLPPRLAPPPRISHLSMLPVDRARNAERAAHWPLKNDQHRSFLILGMTIWVRSILARLNLPILILILF